MELAIAPCLHRPLQPECPPNPLRKRLSSHVEETTLTLSDPDRIEAMAEDMRVVARKRVHHAGLVVCAFVLSALERSVSTEGRMLDARMTYQQLGGPDEVDPSL